MTNFDEITLYVDDLLKIKEYKQYFRNEARILNSFIMNNQRLFHLNVKGKLCIKKSVLDRAINPERHLRDVTKKENNG